MSQTPEQTTRQKRRRNVQRKAPDTTVPSPCLSICMMDNASSYCEGCFRSLDEIRDWMIMDRDEKLAVLAQLDQRRDDAIGI